MSILLNKSSKNRPFVFVLGDSRTGTTSLHKFLEGIGYKSIHFYEKEASVILPYTNENYEENCRRLYNFIVNSEYSAFSDYPTRLFYHYLDKTFPDSKFILSTRPLKEWRHSMITYFSLLEIEIDIDRLESVHLSMNENIRCFFKGKPNNFLEISIGDSDNKQLILDFLGKSNDMEFPWVNRADDFKKN